MKGPHESETLYGDSREAGAYAGGAVGRLGRLGSEADQPLRNWIPTAKFSDSGLHERA